MTRFEVPIGEFFRRMAPNNGKDKDGNEIFATQMILPDDIANYLITKGLKIIQLVDKK